jgi:hypothetical protein
MWTKTNIWRKIMSMSTGNSQEFILSGVMVLAVFTNTEGAAVQQPISHIMSNSENALLRDRRSV